MLVGGAYAYRAGLFGSGKLPDYPTVNAQIGSETFLLHIPQTEAERKLGLGAIRQLPSGHGMLFNGRGQIGIWMKDMKYPIDILWIDERDQVIHVVLDAQPSSYPEKTFRNPAHLDARKVIELNAGEAVRLGVTPGTKIQFH